MRFFFFKTSMEDRDGSGQLKPTLRPLPGQTFDDGTPVETRNNVQAPKESGTSKYGTRLEYPVGTVFCSTYLKTVPKQDGGTFYSVYDSTKGQSPTKNPPDFHPVSDDPAFQYVKPEHRSDRMNVAYNLFKYSGDQTDGTENQKPVKPTMKKTSRTTPADENGKARGDSGAFTPQYTDQFDSEAELAVAWMRRMLNDSRVKPQKKPAVDSVIRNKLDYLYRCGETLDTIASRTRFDNICVAQHMDPAGLATISDGPFQWYVDELVHEHEKGAACTATHRNPDHPLEIRDAAFLVTTKLNDEKGITENFDTQEVLDGMKKAIEAGWTLTNLLDPDRLLNYESPKDFLEAVNSGKLELPQEDSAAGSFVGKLMSDPKNRRPDEKDGFFVGERNWKVLVRNLYRKKNTILLGPTGTGKTEIVRRLCEQTGTPFTLIPMGNITDVTEQLVGKMDLDPATQGTRFDWADFALAIQRPGVVLLDEINRIPRNGDNTLLSVLDGTRCLNASGAKSTDQRTIPVHPDCVFFATANIGSNYTGTKEIDLALMNRFMAVELDYLDTETETTVLSVRKKISREDAKNIALVAANIRQSYKNGTLSQAVSTRETLECAECVRDGFGVEEALEICFLPLFEPGATENDPACERNSVKAKIAQRLNTR